MDFLMRIEEVKLRNRKKKCLFCFIFSAFFNYFLVNNILRKFGDCL